MKVVLFGLGLFYELYKECFTFFDIVALLDNDKRKQNTAVDGVEVIAPDKLKNIEFDKILMEVLQDVESTEANLHIISINFFMTDSVICLIHSKDLLKKI